MQTEIMNTINQDTFPPRETTTAEHSWLVMKFGGTSVSSAGQWQTICDLIREREAAGYRPVIVHSALATISNRLQAALDAAVDGDYRQQYDGIVEIHLQLATELGIDGQALLAGFIGDLEQLLAGIRLIREISPRVHVKVMALGEMMATTLGAAYLQSQGLTVSWTDARDILQSIDVLHENERSRYLSASCAFATDSSIQTRLAATDGVILTQAMRPAWKSGPMFPACSARTRASSAVPGYSGRSVTKKPRKLRRPVVRCCIRAAFARSVRMGYRCVSGARRNRHWTVR